VPKFDASVIPVRPTTEYTPTQAMRVDTTTSTQIARCGVAKRPCMAPSSSGISLSCAIA